jgi:hypothetical protein
MGRTVPTFVQLIQQAAERWKKFRRALRPEDHEHFDRLFVRVRYYTQAATYQCHDNPMEAILLSIALDQEKRLNAVEKVLQNAGVLCDIAARMDSRSLPEPARDDVVADRPEPVALPFDR